MSKSVSGITQRNKRSIRDVERKRNEQKTGQSSGGGNRGKDSGVNHQPPGRYNSERAATFGLWFVGVIGLFFLFFLFSVIFAETTVTVYPESADITVDDTFTAANDSQADGVPYSVIDAEAGVELAATSTGTEYRESEASGEIRIYNDYTSESIRLVPNTRFESSDGLIYRTREAVTVPGQSDSEPGTITATVYANEAGSEYNLSGGSFSIPGFAGTAYEEDVYAETQTAISGGVVGEVPVVSSSTRAQLEDEAGEQLREQLADEVADSTPEGFIVYDDAMFFTTSIGTSDQEEATSTLMVTGQLQAAAFDGRQLSSFLATNYSDDISTESDVRIQNLDEFEFGILDKESVNLNEGFEFTLSGESKIVWQFDERALVRDLRGLQKDRLNEVLVNYESIQEAEVVTRPFWKRTLPDDSAEISVITVVR